MMEERLIKALTEVFGENHFDLDSLSVSVGEAEAIECTGGDGFKRLVEIKFDYVYESKN